MAKDERVYTQEFKKLNMCMYIIMGLLLLLAILLMVTSCRSNALEEENEYDVSMMHTVGVSDVIDMFANEGTYVLYIGRETCSVCHDLLPALQEAQINNNYITQYLDITQVDRSSSDWETLVGLLDVETTTTMDEEGVSEEVTNTFGYFLDAKGFTPCVIIIRDGKQIAGFFGSRSLTNFEDWLANYGI
ncbi:MAG TPA: hypothetical protein IAB40_00075 [Candidatus Onthocola stercoravium]|nr:hypothetical protein [Candidatus Onthocola stercoravium]